jgi:hypothetical protein
MIFRPVVVIDPESSRYHNDDTLRYFSDMSVVNLSSARMLVVTWSSPLVGTILTRSLRHMDRFKQTFRKGVLGTSGETTEQAILCQ